MERVTQQDMIAIAGDALEDSHHRPLRKTSSWEITTFLLPMSIGHFRRVLRESPDLPQGEAEEGDSAANAMRWFSFEEVEVLRHHFASQGRKPAPPRPKTAPVISLVHPYGRSGKTCGVLHLAMAAAMSGLKVLVIDADPDGASTRVLAPEDDPGLGVLPLIARSYGGHLLRANQLRLDQGETPQPMEEAISRALGLAAQDIIRPSRHPNIDLIAAPRSLALADMKIGDWQGGARTWQPWRALYDVIHRDGLAGAYDVIFCDTGAGVGPLTLAVAASSDVLILPALLSDAQAERNVARGLQGLADGLSEVQARENRTARALGQTGMKLTWGGVHVLLSAEAGPVKPMAAQLRARFGTAVLPDAIPHVPALQEGTLTQFYDMAPRDLPRAVYSALRQEMDACWQGLLRQLRQAGY